MDNNLPKVKMLTEIYLLLGSFLKNTISLIRCFVFENSMQTIGFALHRIVMIVR